MAPVWERTTRVEPADQIRQTVDLLRRFCMSRRSGRSCRIKPATSVTDAPVRCRRFQLIIVVIGQIRDLTRELTPDSEARAHSMSVRYGGAKSAPEKSKLPCA